MWDVPSAAWVCPSHLRCLRSEAHSRPSTNVPCMKYHQQEFWVKKRRFKWQPRRLIWSMCRMNSPNCQIICAFVWKCSHYSNVCNNISGLCKILHFISFCWWGKELKPYPHMGETVQSPAKASWEPRWNDRSARKLSAVIKGRSQPARWLTLPTAASNQLLAWLGWNPSLLVLKINLL